MEKAGGAWGESNSNLSAHVGKGIKKATMTVALLNMLRDHRTVSATKGNWNSL
jgi:hypothetical protein